MMVTLHDPLLWIDRCAALFVALHPSVWTISLPKHPVMQSGKRRHPAYYLRT